MELSLAEAARILGVPEHVLYWRARRGQVPAHLVGERYRFNQVELLEWANSNPGATLAAPEPGVVPPAGLCAALARGGIFRELPGADRAAVLRALVERVPLPDPRQRETLLELVVSREDLGTTAVGGEVALPHPRHPIVIGRGEPMAALALLGRPVDFGAPDGRPVRALLLLVSPTPRAHLALLGQAARAFADPRLRELVTAAAPSESILERLSLLESAAGPGAPEASRRRP